VSPHVQKLECTKTTDKLKHDEVKGLTQILQASDTDSEQKQ